MGEVSTIGLDIAKSVFQIHGVDRDGEGGDPQAGKRCEVVGVFRGSAACVIGIEACPTAHHWSREASDAWSHSETDASELCEGLSQAQQE